MFVNVLVVLALIVVVLVVVIALQPAEFRLTRTSTLAAPPAVVFAQVNDLHKWEAWSPWAKLDPAMKQTYEGAPSGIGAVYAWTGNKKVGTGRMTLTENRPGEMVRLRLEFLKPFACTNTTEFTFKPEGGRTAVTWTMAGRNNFMGKACGLVMNVEKMVGADFEKGLAQLQAVVEKRTGGTP